MHDYDYDHACTVVMTDAQRRRADPRTKLTNTAAAAWNNYATTVYMGGTPKQRQWALNTAVKADDQVAAHDRTEQDSRSTYPKAKATKAKAR